MFTYIQNYINEKRLRFGTTLKIIIYKTEENTIVIGEYLLVVFIKTQSWDQIWIISIAMANIIIHGTIILNHGGEW